VFGRMVRKPVKNWQDDKKTDAGLKYKVQ